MSGKKVIQLRPRVDETKLAMDSNDPACLKAVSEALGKIASTDAGAVLPDAKRDTEQEARVVLEVAKAIENANQMLRDERDDDLAAFEAWRAENGDAVAAEHVKRHAERVAASRADLIGWLKKQTGIGIGVSFKAAITELVKSVFGS